MSYGLSSGFFSIFLEYQDFRSAVLVVLFLGALHAVAAVVHELAHSLYVFLFYHVLLFFAKISEIAVGVFYNRIILSWLVVPRFCEKY